MGKWPRCVYTYRDDRISRGNSIIYTLTRGSLSTAPLGWASGGFVPEASRTPKASGLLHALLGVRHPALASPRTLWVHGSEGWTQAFVWELRAKPLKLRDTQRSVVLRDLKQILESAGQLGWMEADAGPQHVLHLNLHFNFLGSYYPVELTRVMCFALKLAFQIFRVILPSRTVPWFWQ
jgi:hypothetical protein